MAQERERARFFQGWDLELGNPGGPREATTLQDLLVIRACHSAMLHNHTLGTAVGVRITKGLPTSRPAVIAFVPYKIAPEWVPEGHLLPQRLQGPGSCWCDLDVLEFNPLRSSSPPGSPGVPSQRPGQEDGEEDDAGDRIYNPLVEGLRGGFNAISPGSQVMTNAGVFATIGPFVVSPGDRAPAGPQGAPLLQPGGFLTTAKVFQPGTAFPGDNGEEDPEGGAGAGAGPGPGGNNEGGGSRGARKGGGNSGSGKGGNPGPGKGGNPGLGKGGNPGPVKVGNPGPAKGGNAASGKGGNAGSATHTPVPEAAEDKVGQEVFHPLTPAVGSGKPVGTLVRLVHTVTDVAWYGIFTSERGDVRVRVDAAHVALHPDLGEALATPQPRGLSGQVGGLHKLSLGIRPQDIAGKRVAKVGRSTGLTHGVILAYAVEYYSWDGRSPHVMDFLIEGEGDVPFSERGDAGAMVFLQKQGTGDTGPEGSEPVWHPLAMLWPFSSQCGRTHFGDGKAPSYWSSAVDLYRTLHVLNLELAPPS